MTGLPQFNYPAFYERASLLRERGHEPVNPAETDGGVVPADYTEDKPYEYWLRKALLLLLQCDAITLLPGWERSKGASLEKHVADTLKMEVVIVD